MFRAFATFQAFATFATFVTFGAFAMACGCAPPPPGPAPLWSADPQGDNPLPDARAQQGGGLVTSPDALRRFLPKGVDTAATDTLLLGWTEQLASTNGWGRFSPVLVRFAAPPASVDAAALSFVALDGDSAPIAVRAAWHANPGVLEVQPLAPLPPGARVALVVTRALVAGERLERSPDFDVHCQGDGKADLEAAARSVGVAPDEVALLVSYRTASSTDDLLRARDLVADLVPSFRFDALDDDRHGVFAAADAPVSITQYPEELDARLAGAGVVAVGFFTSADVRDPETSLFDERVLSGAAPYEDNEIEVVLVEPDPARFPPPWPAVILQHGFSGTDAFVVDNAAAFVSRGMAVLGIDAVSHGRRGSIAGFLRLDDPRIVRDNLRQTVVDQLMLENLATLAAVDVDGVPGNDLDGTVAYYGHSMGAVLGSTFAMVSTRADVVAVNAPGGGLCDVFRSEGLKASLQLLFRPMLGIGIDDPVYDDAFPLLTAMVQTLLEGADPIVYARAGDRPHLLLQMDVDDRLVPNVSTEDLARALEVPSASGATESADGLDALVALHIADFDYPQDKNPHGLFEVPSIQEQAAEFVASRGRTLIDALAP